MMALKFLSRYCKKLSRFRSIEEGFIQERRQRSSLLFGGKKLFNSVQRKKFCTRTMNSSFSSYHLGATHPFLYIILVQLILFFISSWCNSSLCNSSFSSYRPGATHPFLHIILVQLILFFISSWCNSSFSSYHEASVTQQITKNVYLSESKLAQYLVVM